MPPVPCGFLPPGTEFEKRILANESGNSKFNFLREGDPYNAYYNHKVAEFTAAEKGEALPAVTPAAAAPVAAPVAPPPKPAVPVVPPTQPLEEPEKEAYNVPVPEGLTAAELDCIKLCAQFTARNGKSFLTGAGEGSSRCGRGKGGGCCACAWTPAWRWHRCRRAGGLHCIPSLPPFPALLSAGLASREHANPQFNFLKPTHSLFAFFTTLADAYSRVLMPPKGLVNRLRCDASDSAGLLERALRRLEWERAREREATEARDEVEAERMAMLSIDWHDFATVETIEFYDDEDAELPSPMTLKDVRHLHSQGSICGSPRGVPGRALHASPEWGGR